MLAADQDTDLGSLIEEDDPSCFESGCPRSVSWRLKKSCECEIVLLCATHKVECESMLALLSKVYCRSCGTDPVDVEFFPV